MAIMYYTVLNLICLSYVKGSDQRDVFNFPSAQNLTIGLLATLSVKSAGLESRHAKSTVGTKF